MNLIKDIEDFFNEHTNFDNFTKIRYIYLYICKTFSYDTKFYIKFDNIKHKIYDKKFDIKNIQEFEGVCFSISNALNDTLKYFNYDSEIVKAHNEDFSHTYVIVKFENNGIDYKLKLDPTINHDLTRVKLNSPTLGFIDLSDNHDFIDCLEYSDKLIREVLPKINLDEHYDTLKIKELNDLIKEIAKKRNLTEEELFLEKLDYLKCLINIRKDLPNTDDMGYYYSYIIRNLEINHENKEANLKTAFFYKEYNYDDIIWITLVYFNKKPIGIMLLKKETNGYSLKDITKEEAQVLLNSYVNYECQYFFEKSIVEMPEKDKQYRIK